MSDASDMLKKMRDQRESKEAEVKAKNPEELYSRLIISPLKRRQLGFFTFVAFGVTMYLIFNNLSLGNPWWLIVVPIFVIGLLMTLIPMTEQWDYKPWQSHARQYERHQIER